MANQPGGSGVDGEVLYSLCARCGHDRFDAVDCEHGQACPMPKGSRTHEECVECPFRRVEPQPCNGHLMGPSACGDRVRLAQRDLETAPAVVVDRAAFSRRLWRKMDGDQ